MANRRPTQVPLPDGRDPQGAVMGALPGVQRPTGEQFGALSTVAARLSDQVGRIGDTLATAEGKRAGKIDGADPAWRPTGDMTIKGRAYDEAAADTYKSSLDARFRSDALDVYEKNRDNPAGYRAAFEGLVARYQSDHVFPELAGHFEATARTIDTSLRLKTLDNFQTKRRDEAIAGQIRDGARAREDFGRVVEATPEAVPVDGEKENYIRAQEGRIDGLVRQGAKTATEGEREKQQLRADAEATVIMTRAGRMTTPEAVAGYRQQLRDDYLSGKLSGVDFDKVDAALTKREQQLATAGAAGFKAVEKEADDMLGRARAGTPPLADELAALRARAEQVPDGKLITDRLERRMRITEIAYGKGPEALAEIRAGIQRQGAAASPGAADELKWLNKLEDEITRDRAENPVAYLEKGGRIPPTAIPADAKPGDLALMVASRVAALDGARTLQPTLPAHYLKPDEVRGLAERFKHGGDDAVAAAAAIVAGAGGSANTVLRQIGAEAPELGHAAAVMMATGDDQFARQVAAALETRQAGRKLGEKPVGIEEKTWTKAVNARLADAVSGIDPAERARTEAATRLWVEHEAAKRGVDLKAPDQQSQVEELIAVGLDKARGGIGTYGGLVDYHVGGWIGGFIGGHTERVQVPPNVQAGSLRDVFGAIRDDDLARLKAPPVGPDGQPVKAAALRNLAPYAVPGGYAFRSIDKSGGYLVKTPVRTKDGSLFVLPWSDLEPELRQRVPYAFR